MALFELAVLDMAGTTVRDLGEVEDCFAAAARESGVEAPREKVLAMMGWSKRRVFEVLLRDQLGPDHSALERRIDEAYAAFRRILERHYETAPVEPQEGVPELFDWLRRRGVKIALTTGFYRAVTDIILRRLGWNRGLDSRWIGGPDSLIHASLSSDEVPRGRPAPHLIHRAMALLGVEDVRRVVNIGDTPSDLLSGRNAGCALSLGVTNGTHTREKLAAVPNDGLVRSMTEFRMLLETLERFPFKP